jgi:mono/diheme cytochrome c family protein
MRSAACGLYRIVCGAVVVAASVAGPARGQQRLQYNRDVRPILADNCFTCHGPDSASRKADLRLDQRDAAIEMGAIEPGDPDASVLSDRIFTDDLEALMPPPATKKTLTPNQKAMLPCVRRCPR